MVFIATQNNQEKFEQEVSKVLKSELMKGWKFGVQSASKIILKRIEGINEENYKGKIADVKQFCEWLLKDDKNESGHKEAN